MTPAMEKAKKWIISTVAASMAGGVTAAITAAMDPSKYKFPQDFGTGKLWPFFFTGFGLTAFGMLLQSPIGQKLMGTFKATQAQLAQNQSDLEQAKAELKGTVTSSPPTPKS